MNTQTRSNSPDIYSILSQTQRLRVSDGEIKPQPGTFYNLELTASCQHSENVGTQAQ